MKFHHRLRTKLIVIFSIVTLIPALIIGIYAIQVSSKSLRTQVITPQTIYAKTLGNNVTSFLKRVKGDLMFLSQSPVLKDYLNQRAILKLENAESQSEKSIFPTALEPQRQYLEQEFLAFSRYSGIYYQIRYLNETGQEIVRVDSNGLISNIIKRDNLQDKFHRYYFKETIRLLSNELFVSPLDLNREQKQIERPFKPVIRYAVNVYDNKNHKAGIVMINVDAKQFIKPLDNIRLINQNGYFMSHPDPKKLWGGPVDLNTGYSLEKEYPLWAKQILGKNGTLSTQTLTISHRKVSIPGFSHNWTVIVQRDTDDIMKSVTKFRAMFTVILTVSVLIALLLAWIFSSKITRPLDNLTRLVEAISKGEQVSNPVVIKDKGEIGQLAIAFERMRVSMIESFEKLRKQSRKK